MPDPDRLKELQRQRALVQEHLAWLDRQIASENDTPVAAIPAGSPPAEPALVPFPAPKVSPGESEAAAERILAQYREKTKSLPTEIKRGCVLYFIFALGLLAIGLGTLYIISRYQ